MDSDQIQDNLPLEPQALEPEPLLPSQALEPQRTALNDDDYSALKEQVIDALKSIYDPEIPVNIYDLGLIYGIGFKSQTEVEIIMTLTTPGCPVAQTFPEWVEQSIQQLEGIESATVEIVWEPPWSMDRMTEAAKLELGML